MKRLFLMLIITFSFTVIGCKKDNSRVSIIGAWNCEELSDYGQRNYQVNIIRNPFFPDATNEYIINNFHKLGFGETTEVYVREEEPGILNITGTTALHIYFIGTGIIADDFSRIAWEYEVNDGLTNPSVIANYY